MKIDRRWLWFPPLLALLVVLGPLGGAGSHDGTATETSTATETGTATETTGDRLPEFPGLVQVAATLGVVLLVGIGALWLLARLKGQRGPLLGAPGLTRRGAATPAGAAPAPPIQIRQSVRLSPRSSLHAVEFDGQVLLVGESEHGPVLLHGSDPTRDEREVLGRTAAEDDGAELKDTLIPRPDHAARDPVHRRTPSGGTPVALSHFEDVLRAARTPHTEPQA